MDIIQIQAIEFTDDYFESNSSEIFCNIKDLKENLTGVLSSFYKQNDKIIFLNALKDKVIEDKIDHEKDCRTDESKCIESQEKNLGIFVINQEIDIILANKEYIKDSFTHEERTNIEDKLKIVLNKIEELSLGQEIIFNEIDELKLSFNLGKKNWFQLLKGKLIDLTVEKVIDEVVVKEIYDILSENFSDFPKLINNI